MCSSARKKKEKTNSLLSPATHILNCVSASQSEILVLVTCAQACHILPIVYINVYKYVYLYIYIYKYIVYTPQAYTQTGHVAV